MNLMLRNVVMSDGGTAAKARVDGFMVAGKTGTAQMVNPENGTYFQNRHVSSFVGFLPADDPRLLILVVLYDVGHEHFGGLVAAPVFSEIAQGAVRNLNITAPKPFDVASIVPLLDSANNPSGANATPAASAVDDYLPVLTGSRLTRATPKFSGLSLRSAIELARLSKVNVDVHGAGYVVAQDPEAGSALNHSTIKLTLAPVIANRSDDRAPKKKPARVTAPEIVPASYTSNNSDPAGRK
jgi:cell division protein FtsI (penicillin-binding protein 3)